MTPVQNETVSNDSTEKPLPGPNVKINWLMGKLSWRVISSVFATIVVVQGMILYFTMQNFEQDQLFQLSETGRSAVMPILNTQNITALDVATIQRLTETTSVRGLAFYEPGRPFAKDVYGEPPLLVPDRLNPDTRLSWINDTKTRYEVTFGPQQVKGAYALVIRLDSEYIKIRKINNVKQTAIVSFLLSAFITTVLILVLGKWMIEPILRLRNNLLGAARDPAHPKYYLTRYRRRDELGSVISSANKLILQNANNMNRLNQQANDKIYRIAYYDALTQLPNRVHFLNKLDEILSSDEKNKYPHLGILVMDIDHFGDVNNTLGFEMGDQLLKHVGTKLQEVLPDAVLVARLSEDAFAAIIDLPADPHNIIKQNAEAVLNIFNETFSIQGNEIVLEGTAGLALWPNDGERANDLLKKAESAIDQAKQEEKGSFRVYSPSFDQAVHNRIQMVQDLRVAIEEKQFALVYQPQFCATTGVIIGAEALLRWERPDPETGKKSFVRPDHFIPVAEQSGLIVPIGRWVLEEACRFAKECQTDGLAPFRVAVNMSGIQFHRDDVIALTKHVLEKTQLEPHFLELEVTESAVMKDINQTIALLKQLKDLGVELAIDDFGTGYSSLSYLKRFPVHRLKVDRSFIMNVTETAEDASITSTIIQLGHSIGLKVIAEGVETQGQIDFLRAHNCDEFQGYFFSKPLPPVEFRGFVKGYVRAA